MTSTFSPRAPTSQAELVELIHRYYPTGLHESEPAYTASPQMQRLANARREAVAHRAPWDRFLERSRAALPGARVDDWSFRLEAGHDACYQARIDPAGLPAPVPRRDEVVVLASILAPVYFLYTSVTCQPDQGPPTRRLFPRWIERTRKVHEALEALVRDETASTALPARLLFLRLPDLQYRNLAFGEVRLVDCLFLPSRW